MIGLGTASAHACPLRLEPEISMQVLGMRNSHLLAIKMAENIPGATSGQH